MKKIFRLLLLGFLTITFITPNVVNAEENHVDQEMQSSFYTTQNIITPDTTPSEEEFTLKNGESHTATRLAFLDGIHYVVGWTLLEILSDDEEAYSVTPLFIFDTTTSESETIFAHDRGGQIDSFEYGGAVPGYEFPFIFRKGVRITNYSPGAVKYKLTFHIDYRDS